MSRVKLPFEGATSIFSKSTYSDLRTDTCISALSPIIIDIGYKGRSGAPATSIDAISLPLIINCSPLGVITFSIKKPPTFTSTIISSSDDDTRRSCIFIGAHPSMPTHSCEMPATLIRSAANIKKYLFIINQLQFI